ncbi:MAG: HAMP domain-containing histidine kinase [Polyangiaceae bacterium]|nr:HAMP domain-containing histidine kinase [Polyangiaceae bacterium]
MRLKHRLSLSLTLVAASVLGVSFVTAYLVVAREETRHLDESIRAEAKATAFVLSKSAGPPRVEDARVEDPERPKRVPRHVVVYAANGDVLASTSKLSPPPPLSALGDLEPGDEDGSTQTLTISGRTLRAVVMPLARDRTEILLYAVSQGTVDEDLAYLERVFALLFLGATTLTGVLARWLGTRLASDVDAIASVARSVAEGQLTARVGGTLRGSSETASLGRDLDHMIAELERLITIQRTFVSHAAHELRSPLATLRGELQLALRRPRSAEEYKGSIEEALAETEALITLAQDLLVLARAQRAPTAASTESRLDEVLSDAVRLARGPAEARGVELSTPATPDARVRGPRADLARLFRNLLDNAVAHSPPGARVELSATMVGQRVSVAVVDAGAGVAAEDADEVFAAFYRGAKDRSSDATGAGLGLPIAREIARAHGGDVWLDRAWSRGGARFVVELPMASETPPDSSRAAAAPDDAAG